MGEFLKVSKEGALATITFAREKGLNALSTPVLKELAEAWDELENDGQTRVCIVCGEGKAFIVGADIKEMASLDHAGAVAFSACGQKVFSAIENSSIVTIAAIHGAALGGGCELALACDIRLASDPLKIGQPEVSLGVIPGFGGTQRLARVVGLGNAMNMILGGDPISAEQALQVGLVSKVSAKDDLMADAKKLAEKILSKGPVAVQTAKQCVRQAVAVPLDEGLAFERETFGKTFASGEAKEGMSAFLEKRAPDFKS